MKFLEEPEIKQQIAKFDDLKTYVANHSGLGHIDNFKKLVHFFGVFESQVIFHIILLAIFLCAKT